MKRTSTFCPTSSTRTIRIKITKGNVIQDFRGQRLAGLESRVDTEPRGPFVRTIAPTIFAIAPSIHQNQATKIIEQLSKINKVTVCRLRYVCVFCEPDRIRHSAHMTRLTCDGDWSWSFRVLRNVLENFFALFKSSILSAFSIYYLYKLLYSPPSFWNTYFSSEVGLKFVNESFLMSLLFFHRWKCCNRNGLLEILAMLSQIFNVGKQNLNQLFFNHHQL